MELTSLETKRENGKETLHSEEPALEKKFDDTF